MALLAELICDVPGKGKMQLMSLSASEGLSRPFEYQVDILSDKANLDLAKFLGSSMTIALELPNGKRYFNGLVARFGHSGRRTRQFFHYQATLRPWFWFLSRTQDCKIFQEKTVVQIVEEVFADHSGMAKVTKKLTGTYTPWDYCVQYRESDMNFVARLLEQEGIYYYFNHTEDGHELVLCDNASAHQTVNDYAEISFQSNWTQAHGNQGETIQSWAVGVQVLPTKVVLADYDFERPSTALRKDSTVARQHDLASYEVFDYPGEYTKDGDGSAYAKSRAQEQQAGYQVASGQSDARGMTCGSTFKVKGLPDESQDGEYLVLSTNIYVEEGLELGGEEGSEGQYSCDFQVIPTADKYRAPRLTPKPMVYGPQTAMVVGPSAVKAHDVHTDKYGRIKVQFHWDRIGKKDDKSSCWIRVSQPWAGKNFGIISLPRVGDEVVVSFMEGDPDQPLVTGRVYNAESMPPYALPANASVTTVLTRSMGSTDGKQANELRFEDKPGKEYIWLQAQKDFHREVENNDHDTVKNDQYIEIAKKRQETIGADLDQTVGGNVKEKYGGDHHIDVAGDHIQNVGGVMNLKSGGEFSLDAGAAGGFKFGQGLDVKAGMDMKAQAGMNVHIKGGMNVTIEAGMTLTLKAGAGTIVIGPATISIDAPLVNINGGGGGGAASAASPPAPAKPKPAVKPKAVPDPLKPATSAAPAAAKTAPAAKAAPAKKAAAKKAPAAKKAASAAVPPAAAKSAPAAKSASAPAASPAAKTAAAPSGTSGMIVQKKGPAYRDDQIAKHSHYNDPIDRTPGRLAGNSRVWGDASAETQQASIDALVNASSKAGLSKHDTAMVLAIAHTESGFNPDAAAGTTSAAGLGQFVDRTGKAYGLDASNRWDTDAQAKALVDHYVDNKNLAAKRGLGEEYIYKYHHDGPKGEYGGLGISEKKVMPLAKKFEAMLGG